MAAPAMMFDGFRKNTLNILLNASTCFRESTDVFFLVVPFGIIIFIMFAFLSFDHVQHSFIRLFIRDKFINPALLANEVVVIDTSCSRDKFETISTLIRIPFQH